MSFRGKEALFKVFFFSEVTLQGGTKKRLGKGRVRSEVELKEKVVGMAGGAE